MYCLIIATKAERQGKYSSAHVCALVLDTSDFLAVTMAMKSTRAFSCCPSFLRIFFFGELRDD